MPIIKFEENAGYSWAVWEITETEGELYAFSALTLEEEAEFASIRHKEKRKEYLTGRLVLKALIERHANANFKGVFKDSCGKPYLIDHDSHISLSHSFPFVTAIVHLHKSAGIDIEKPQPKLLTIAKKVLSLEEQAESAGDQKKICVYWSAKEALYKIYGRKQVTFSKHLSIAPFTFQEKDSTLQARITMPGHKSAHTLRYVLFNDYIICFNE